MKKKSMKWSRNIILKLQTKGEGNWHLRSAAVHRTVSQTRSKQLHLNSLMRLSQDTMDVVRRFQIRLRDALYLISVVVLAEMSM